MSFGIDNLPTIYCKTHHARYYNTLDSIETAHVDTEDDGFGQQDDCSGDNWGWRITVTGSIPATKTRSHWLKVLYTQLVECACLMLEKMISCGTDKCTKIISNVDGSGADVEKQQAARWLEMPLFSEGFCDGASEFAREQKQSAGETNEQETDSCEPGSLPGKPQMPETESKEGTSESETKQTSQSQTESYPQKPLSEDRLASLLGCKSASEVEHLRQILRAFTRREQQSALATATDAVEMLFFASLHYFNSVQKALGMDIPHVLHVFTHPFRQHEGVRVAVKVFDWLAMQRRVMGVKDENSPNWNNFVTLCREVGGTASLLLFLHPRATENKNESSVPIAERSFAGVARSVIQLRRQQSAGASWKESCHRSKAARELRELHNWHETLLAKPLMERQSKSQSSLVEQLFSFVTEKQIFKNLTVLTDMHACLAKMGQARAEGIEYFVKLINNISVFGPQFTCDMLHGFRCILQSLSKDNLPNYALGLRGAGGVAKRVAKAFAGVILAASQLLGRSAGNPRLQLVTLRLLLQDFGDVIDLQTIAHSNLLPVLNRMLLQQESASRETLGGESEAEYPRLHVHLDSNQTSAGRILFACPAVGSARVGTIRSACTLRVVGFRNEPPLVWVRVAGASVDGWMVKAKADEWDESTSPALVLHVPVGVRAAPFFERIHEFVQSSMTGAGLTCHEVKIAMAQLLHSSFVNVRVPEAVAPASFRSVDHFTAKDQSLKSSTCSRCQKPILQGDLIYHAKQCAAKTPYEPRWCGACARIGVTNHATHYDGAFCILSRANAAKVRHTLASRGIISFVVPRKFLHWDNFCTTSGELTPCRDIILCSTWMLVEQLLVLIQKAPAKCAAVLRDQIIEFLSSQLEAQMQTSTTTLAKDTNTPLARSLQNPLPNPTWVRGWSAGLSLETCSFPLNFRMSFMLYVPALRGSCGRLFDNSSANTAHPALNCEYAVDLLEDGYVQFSSRMGALDVVTAFKRGVVQMKERTERTRDRKTYQCELEAMRAALSQEQPQPCVVVELPRDPDPFQPPTCSLHETPLESSSEGDTRDVLTFTPIESSNLLPPVSPHFVTCSKMPVPVGEWCRIVISQYSHGNRDESGGDPDWTLRTDISILRCQSAATDAEIKPTPPAVSGSGEPVNSASRARSEINSGLESTSADETGPMVYYSAEACQLRSVQTFGLSVDTESFFSEPEGSNATSDYYRVHCVAQRGESMPLLRRTFKDFSSSASCMRYDGRLNVAGAVVASGRVCICHWTVAPLDIVSPEPRTLALPQPVAPPPLHDPQSTNHLNFLIIAGLLKKSLDNSTKISLGKNLVQSLLSCALGPVRGCIAVKRVALELLLLLFSPRAEDEIATHDDEIHSLKSAVVKSVWAQLVRLHETRCSGVVSSPCPERHFSATVFLLANFLRRSKAQSTANDMLGQILQRSLDAAPRVHAGLVAGSDVAGTSELIAALQVLHATNVFAADICAGQRCIRTETNKKDEVIVLCVQGIECVVALAEQPHSILWTPAQHLRPVDVPSLGSFHVFAGLVRAVAATFLESNHDTAPKKNVIAEIQCRALASLHDLCSESDFEATETLPPRYVFSALLRGFKQRQPNASQTFAWGAHSGAITVQGGTCKKSFGGNAAGEKRRDVCVSDSSYSRGKYIWHFRVECDRRNTAPDAIVVRLCIVYCI